MFLVNLLIAKYLYIFLNQIGLPIKMRAIKVQAISKVNQVEEKILFFRCLPEANAFGVVKFLQKSNSHNFLSHLTSIDNRNGYNFLRTIAQNFTVTM